jgi:regulation of enolase protein 1 (concanavalin A-like superfamily)
VGSYSLTAVATDNRGGTTSSAPVSVTVNPASNPVPAPWTSQDVGPVGLAGSATFADGTYTLQGSGLNIGGTADQFHFVWQTMSGDGQITARITGVQNTNFDSKGGIMIRESLATGAPNVAMVITGGNRLQFQRRMSAGATTSYLSWGQAPPYWVRLVRTGDTFTAYRSTSGGSWLLAGSYVIPMTHSVSVGLVMSSRDNTLLGTATLTNVSLVTGSPNAVPIVGVTAPAEGTAFTDPVKVTVTASASDSDGSVAKVEIFEGASLLATLTTAPYTWDWNVPPPGPHAITARATDNLGATATSAAVNFSVSYSPSAIPSPWTDADVGAVGLPGSASFANPTFTVVGSGINIGGTSDQFHFVYQPLSGDGEIVARITGVQNTTPESKGGIMIRESLAPNATNASMVITGGNRIMFQRRMTTGATTNSLSWNQTTPHWVKLVRTGDTISAYRSTTGVSWTLSGTFTIPMAPTVYVGLVMSSRDNTVTGTATLDGVSVTLGP